MASFFVRFCLAGLPGFLFYSNLSARPVDSSYAEMQLHQAYNFISINSDSVSFYLDQAKAACFRSNYKKGLVRYYTTIAAEQIAHGSYSEAHRYYDSALSICEEYNLSSNKLKVHVLTALLFQYTNDFLNAGRQFIKAAELANGEDINKLMQGQTGNMLQILNRITEQNNALQLLLPAVNDNSITETELAGMLAQHKQQLLSFYFPDGTVVKETSSINHYVILGGAAFRVDGWEQLSFYQKIYKNTTKIPDGLIQSIPRIPKDGTIIGDDFFQKVFYIKEGKRYWITSPEVQELFGGRDVICTAPYGGLTQVPAGDVDITIENARNFLLRRKDYFIIADSLTKAIEQNTNSISILQQGIQEKNRAIQIRRAINWSIITSLAALLVIIGIIRRNNHLQLVSVRKQKELEEVIAINRAREEERTRISRDLHDDLGAGLTKIKFGAENLRDSTAQADVVNGINGLQKTAGDLVDKMNEIIWALNESNNSLEDLIFYLRSYAVEYCNENGLEYEFLVPENIAEFELSGVFRRNLFLVLKEALHNVVKHANATLVSIEITLGEDFEIIIKDNGQVSKIEKIGNGILNMQKRIELLGGKFIVRANEGLELKISVPLNPNKSVI